jgi:ribonuclease E
MPKQIIIAEQHRLAAVFSEDQIQELIVATGSHQVGDIYLGAVENVLPGIDAAFVNIGDSERNGFIHVSDLGPLRLKRTAASITELLAPQQKVLVQVMKEPTGSKGPRLTGNVTLPGRYLVLMPFGKGVNLSRRIRNENERNRLRALAILVKPAGMGLLVRTEAEGVSEDAIIEDLESLQRQWESIQQEAMTTRAPNLLNRDDDFIQRVLRDMYSADVNRIVVDSHAGMKRVKQHLASWSGGKAPQGVLVDHHRDRIPLLEYFRVNAAIREALKPRVDLPSGGYIIIEPTEALTVVDVNSGSFTRSATARETVLWTNCEAAVEIARQLRLRNIAGVIIVDFIDMDSRRDQMQVLEQFNKALKADKSRPQISQLSELGLVELTRKRQGQNIYELFGRTCPTCGGQGHIVHLPGEREGSESAATLEVVPSIEARSAAASREVWEAPSDDLSLNAQADPADLDLLNHPSYQDRGSASRRRRRRRVVESTPRTSPKLPDVAETPDEAEEVAPTSAPAAAPAAKEARSDKPDRRSSRRERTPAQPPQVVFVEMTQEEQELYAMMGISPLVLSPEPVKDPRSTVVQVVLPGEAKVLPDAALPTPTVTPTITSVSTEEEDSEPETEDKAVAESQKNSSSSKPAPILMNKAPAVQEASGDSKHQSEVQSLGSEEEANPDAAENGTGGARRRRRRRSSAANSDGE